MRVVIVDDEKPARQRLLRLLARAQSDVDVIGEASDGLEALAAIEEHRPDLVFLDIQMPELDGLAVAQALGPDGPAIIFATAYDEHALEAYEAAALDYLVKPIAEERLFQALERFESRRAPAHDAVATVLAQLHAAQPPKRIAVKSGAQYLVVDPRQISCVLAQDHYAVLRRGKEELLCDESLDRLAERLGPDFVQIHRGAVINLTWLASLDREGDRKYFAVLSDPLRTRAPVSRDRLPEVKRALGLA